MPLTPFIGLSVFAHILLIIIFKIFRIPPKVWRLRKVHGARRAWQGSAIIISIFSFVMISAFFLVRASALEKHSSVMFVEQHISILNDWRSPPLIKVASASQIN